MVERKWRRIRDSNPRYALKAHTRFPIVPLQPARAILRIDACLTSITNTFL